MRFFKYMLVLTSLSFMVSCGGGEKKEEKNSMKIGVTKTSKKENNNTINIGITGSDLMQFSKKEIRVKVGQEVTLTLKHVGTMELVIMGHNFVLLKSGIDISAFAQEATIAGKDADWIPNEGKDVIAHTKMVGGGQTATVTFTAPEAGTYDFICSFSGHYGTMKGKFIVE
ncbi:MAG: azurin [Flavobacteriaceae bacterium]|nr:azurin [Flavobacteriaceae bacterium]